MLSGASSVVVPDCSHYEKKTPGGKRLHETSMLHDLISDSAIIVVGRERRLRAWAGVYASLFGHYDITYVHRPQTTRNTTIHHSMGFKVCNDLTAQSANYSNAHDLKGKRQTR